MVMIRGNTITKMWVDEMTVEKKIFWLVDRKSRVASARTRIMPRGLEVGVTDRDMQIVHEWCLDHDCGKRVSFDTFRFHSNAELAMFLLRWS